jgi:ribonucleoside-diphosphate reductase alpha chain
MGPSLEISEYTHALKYRAQGESFYDAMVRIAAALSDNDEHRLRLKDILLNQRFLPAGRIQASVGAAKTTCAHNCFVSGTIEDSMDSIMDKLKDAAQTLRMGGGDGYDFSTLRPKGSNIVTLNSESSGPISFMNIFDAMCQTISSAGHRRGAQMAVLRVDHPDIEEFIKAKQNSDKLKAFNLSIAVTDQFMDAVWAGESFDLIFNGEIRSVVDARNLWDMIMRSTWEWAEPGVLFIDQINRMNNLAYCETIAATNPCAEQPLPPNGACLLGSFNLVKYLKNDLGGRHFDYSEFRRDIKDVVRAMDNVIDIAIYPLKEQEEEAKSKRRMGLGVTGVANAIEYLGYNPHNNDYAYGSIGYVRQMEKILSCLRDEAYNMSIKLSIEKGSFPDFDSQAYWGSKFIRTLPAKLQTDIYTYGIRNSHLLSIAPAGTISLTADNVSSGIEPVFSYRYNRDMHTPEGLKTFEVTDYGLREFDVKGKTVDDVTVEEHVAVLLAAQKYIDSAVSKTCNVSDFTTYQEFKDIYYNAWKGGAKGCTTFRASGKRFGILNKIEEEPVDAACYVDETTGSKTCE